MDNSLIYDGAAGLQGLVYILYIFVCVNVLLITLLCCDMFNIQAPFVEITACILVFYFNSWFIDNIKGK